MSVGKHHLGLEEGWAVLEEGILKAASILDGWSESCFTPKEYMKFYECVYRMSVQKVSYNQELYDRFKFCLEQCVNVKVLPSLMDKQDMALLQELITKWSNFQIMVKCLLVFFGYLDRYHTIRSRLPPLNEVAISCFRSMIFRELNDKLRHAVNSLVDREREGQQIGADLLKNVVDLICKFDLNSKGEFEKAILDGTSAYYLQKAIEWSTVYPLSDYLFKVEECLKIESCRLTYYFYFIDNHQIQAMLQNLYQSLIKQFPCHLPVQDSLVVNQDLSAMCAKLTIEDRKKF